MTCLSFKVMMVSKDGKAPQVLKDQRVTKVNQVYQALLVTGVLKTCQKEQRENQDLQVTGYI